MSTQPPITAFFVSKKRRATDVIHRDAKLHKGDPTLLQFGYSKNSEGPDVNYPVTQLSNQKAQYVKNVSVNKVQEINLEPVITEFKTELTNHASIKSETDIAVKPNAIVAENISVKLEPSASKEHVTSTLKKGADIQMTNIFKKTHEILNTSEEKRSVVPAKAAEILGCTQEEIMRKPPTTPLKDARGLPSKSPGCDVKSFMTSKSPYRPDCRSGTPVKYIRMEPTARKNETTPAKTSGSIMKSQNRPPSAVKKSIRFDESKSTATCESQQSIPEIADTDDIIQAANDLVEKLKNKSRNLSDLSKPKPGKKPEVMTASVLKKKLAHTAKLAQLKSSLSRLGQQASELIKIEKKKKQAEEPKIRKFDSIEIDVPLSPHKGALASPLKSPAKPAHERFGHLIHRTTHSTSATLPLPIGYQKLLDMFTATDTVCSMMLNRGELITFKKLKQPVAELSRHNLSERHVAQMAAVLPGAFNFRQEKLRNFGSTSKIDRYELVIAPNIVPSPSSEKIEELTDTSNLIVAADRKKMTPKLLLQRKEAFHKSLMQRTMEKHDEFLSGLDPPLNVAHSQLTRWHPNFPVDMVPDVPPVCLPEPPTVANAPTTAKDVLERATKLLAANSRMKNALEAASAQSAEASPAATDAANSAVPLTAEAKAAIDKRVAVHDPLKGISKSLLDKIRAKQAVKALEAMKVTPADEKELMLLTKLPDMASKLRFFFVNKNKNVIQWDTVVDGILFSANRAISKGDVEATLRRLLAEVPPGWLSIVTPASGGEYLKLDRAMPSRPIIEMLEKKAAEKKRMLT